MTPLGCREMKEKNSDCVPWFSTAQMHSSYIKRVMALKWLTEASNCGAYFVYCVPWQRAAVERFSFNLHEYQNHTKEILM
jgi:hypothetical protein